MLVSLLFRPDFTDGGNINVNKCDVYIYISVILVRLHVMQKPICPGKEINKQRL